MNQSLPFDKKAILVVEDEALLRFDVVAFFEDEGWHVYDAENAERAIDLLDHHPEIRVVLTDVNMPGDMDGLRLAHYVRDRFPPTLLFIVSGEDAIAQDALPARTTFLPKPFDLHRLLKSIDHLLTRASASG